MSANTRGSAPISQDRARTYNVVKDSWRRVKCLAYHRIEQQDTQSNECKQSREKPIKDINNISLNDETNQFPACLKTEVEQKHDKFLQQETAPILPLLPSKAAQGQLSFRDSHENMLSNVTLEEISYLGRNLTLSSSDTKSSSESSSIFRKEDTFIVTDRRRRTAQISSSEDLRLRKAMALAKANARHAIKNKMNNILKLNNGGTCHQPHVRAFIESTGSEVKNERGEKIYFQWKESENSQNSRVPQGVRKLYEYKKKRLKHKQLNIENSKSAPNKKSYNDKLSSEKSEIMKRSRTSEISSTGQKLAKNNVHYLRNRSPSFSRPLGNTQQAALAVAEKDSFKYETTDTNNKCFLTLTEKEGVKNGYSRMTINEGYHKTSSANILIESTQKQTGTTNIIEDSNGSLPASYSSGQYVQTFVNSDSVNLLHKNILVAPNPPAPSASMKKASQVPYEHKIKVLSVPKFKVPLSHRKGRRPKSSKNDVKCPNNKIHNSTVATKNIENLYEPSSYLQTSQNSGTQIQIKPELTSKSEDVILAQKTDTINSQAIKSTQSALLDNSSTDKDLPPSYGSNQVFSRSLSTKIIDDGLEDCKTSNGTAHLVENNKSEQIYDHIYCKHHFIKYGGVKKESTRRKYPGQGHQSETFHRDHKGASEQQVENTDEETDNAHELRNSKERENNNCINNRGVTNKKYGLPVDVADNNLKQLLEIDLPRSDCQDQLFNSSIHEPVKIKLRTGDGDSYQTQKSSPTHDAVKISSTLIDQNSVNKSDKKGNIHVTCHRQLQFERTPHEQEVQPRVSEQKQGNASVTSDDADRSPQGVGVSPATSQVNKNMTTVEDKRKQAVGMKGPLSHLTAARNNRRSEQTEVCHNVLKQNDLLPQRVSVNGLEKNLLPMMEKTFSNQLISDNGGDIFMINISGNPGVLDKHARQDFQSIANSVSKEMLKLELAEFNNDDAVKTQSLSINRYKNETILPQGKPHLQNDVPQKRNTAMNNVSPRKSKTLKNLPKNKMSKTKLDLRQETKENFKGTHRVTRNRQELNLDVSANNSSKIQERRTNSDSYEDTSIASYKSITTEQIINGRIRTDAGSTGEYCETYRPVNSGELVSEDIIPAEVTAQGDNLQDNKISCDIIAGSNFEKPELSENNTSYNSPRANISSVSAGCSDVLSSNVQKHDDLPLKVEQRTEFVNISQAKKLEKPGCREKNYFQNNQMRTKVPDRKRQTVSLHTQNMEFREMPKENGTQPAVSTKPPLQSNLYNMQEIRKSTNRNFVPKLNGAYINLESKGVPEQGGGMSNSETTLQEHSRPKTAGLSAYSKHQSEDLWSTNTGGDDDDDDDDGDDQIQFIEGEQDFFKVFGYDEETAAILIATKVYPVSDSAGTYGNFGENGSYFNDTTAQELYMDGLGSSRMTNHVNNSGANNISGYEGTFSKSRNDQPRNQAVSKLPEQKILMTLKNNSTRTSIKQTSDVPQGTQNSDHHYLDIYRKQKTNQTEGIMKDGLTANNRNMEHSSYFKENGSSLEISQSNKGVSLKASGNEIEHQKESETAVTRSHFPPALETLTLLGTSQEGDEYKARRRIYSEADILNKNLETSQTFPDSDYLSDGNLSMQSRKLISYRDFTFPANKDSKSHVALRNQLATERHINQTRYHRQINSNVTQLQKSNALQMSSLAEPRNSRAKDIREMQNSKSKDFSRTSQIRSTESSGLYEQASGNPYWQAADRILSRITDTDSSIYSRSNMSNTTATQSKFSSNSKDTTNSPLRRMSHPVDSARKHTQHASSYFVSRPRKLEPITQLSQVKNSQK